MSDFVWHAPVDSLRVPLWTVLLELHATLLMSRPVACPAVLGAGPASCPTVDGQDLVACPTADGRDLVACPTMLTALRAPFLMVHL